MFEDVFDDDDECDGRGYPVEPTADEPLQRGPGAALLWGAFLGCSWTWVIGMVFPALLLRDYGLKGWAAFAVPNVLGAAAMGTVLFKPAWSARIVRSHAIACHNFTVITVAFHLYVASWLFTALFGFAAAPMLVVAVGLCAGLGMRDRNRAMLFVAVGVALLSWGCFVWGTLAPDAWALAEWTPDEPRLSSSALWAFLPCSVLGFLLCPYLDLTFHRARINATGKAAGPLAFAFGFGGVFFLMIIFSVCYGAQLLPFIQGQPDTTLHGMWLILLGVHLTVQAAFTLTIHTRETLEDRATGGASVPWLIAASGLAILLGFVAQIDDLPTHPMAGGLSWGEVGYRALLLFYGTVFPAYVWLVMIPTRRPLTRFGVEARTGVYALSSGLAYALAWMVFIRDEHHLVPYIFALLIGARGIIELLPKERSA